MGITNFNSWLRKSYPECFSSGVNINNKIEYKNYDCVYVDLNFLLHNVIYSSHNQKSFLTKLYYKLDCILNTNFALKQIIIAIDGPGPYSKIDLQRKRRLLSNSSDSNFNSLLLTPGTEFMNSLEVHMKNYIESRKRRYRYRKVEFKLISSNEPDEGEIKLLKELHNIGTKNRDYTHLIVGCDADLVVSASAQHNINNIYILIKEPKGYILFDFDRFILQHAQRCMGLTDTSNFIFVKSFYRKDFAMISIMMGNDYLPKLGGANFENIWDAYKTTKADTDYFLMIDRTINRIFFQKFLENYTSKISKRNFLKSSQKDVQSYINGLLWCIDMYFDGICKMYDFELNMDRCPNPFDILRYHQQNLIDFSTPKSDAKPLSPEVCGIVLLPKKSSHMLPKNLLKITDKLDNLYEIEMCKKCENFRKKIGVYNKKLYEEKNNEIINEDEIKKLRESLKSIQEDRDLHILNHNSVDIKDIRRIIEENLN